MVAVFISHHYYLVNHSLVDIMKMKRDLHSSLTTQKTTVSSVMTFILTIVVFMPSCSYSLTDYCSLNNAALFCYMRGGPLMLHNAD